MRSIIFIIFLFAFSGAHSEDFTVFEKEGYFGIKDETGQITVPAVYEKLGWSTGEDKIFEGLIGYKKGNSWGLITVRNKALTEQKFFSLEPFEEGYIKGSIKGKFSNHLFYGLLDTKGKTKVSFNYFALTKLGNDLLVSEFEGGRQHFGLISMENEVSIPLKYKFIEYKNGFFVGSTFDQTLDIFYNKFLIQSSLDSIQFSNGIVGYRAGYAGFINEEGILILDLDHKSIVNAEGKVKGVKFPTWQVYKDQELQFEWQCDSIGRTENKIWVGHLNGAQHILLPEAENFDSKNFVIQKVENDFVIVQHSKTRKFSAIDTKGKILVAGYDSLTFSQTHFLGMKKGKWDIISPSGTKLHKVSFGRVIAGPENFFIVSKNNYWGVVDFNGEKYITFKYDSIVYTETHYEVKYLNKWGALDFYGNWIVEPDFSSIQSYGDVIVGQRGLAYSIFYNSHLRFKTTAKPICSFNGNIVVESDSNRFGLINQFGEMIAEPNYDEIIPKENFFKLKTGNYSTLIAKDSKIIFDENDRIEDFGKFSESLFSIKKNGRWGFVDDLGKLRISNRYDSVHFFSEGLAGIQLRNRWGYINKEEALVIQPYYDNISSFKNGLAIVTSNNLSGLINREGKVIVELAYKGVSKLSTENYLIEDQNGRFGLLNRDGKFLIRPSYPFLRDTGDGIIIVQNGRWGYLDYQGNQLFKLQYSLIEVVENFILLKI